MSISTNAELETAVANWLDRTDLSARIPEFVVLAEARFNRILRAPDMLTRDDAFTVDSQYETLPTGFIEVSRFALNTSPVTTLEYLTPEEMSEKRYHRISSGRPAYYSVVGGNFEFWPSPDSAYTGLLVYYKTLTANATSANWLFTSHPDIYLFGALCEAEPYVHNDERMPMWKARLDQALMELRAMNDRKRAAGTLRPTTGGFE